MMKVFENGQLPINARVDNGLLKLAISFDEQPDQAGNETAQIFPQKPH
jgi:hypothetical protein